MDVEVQGLPGTTERAHAKNLATGMPGRGLRGKNAQDSGLPLPHLALGHPQIPWVVTAAVFFDQSAPHSHPPEPTRTRLRACLMSHQVLSQSEKGKEAAGQVVDARSLARFKAEAPEPRAGVAGGHVPGSACVPFVKVLVDGDVNR